jgi:PIN domain nuclease of toxin-antitoxin system
LEGNPARLSKRVETELSNPANELWLSSVSMWEALTLMQKGRIRMKDPFEWVERAAEQMREAPLTQENCAPGVGDASAARRSRGSLPGSYR